MELSLSLNPRKLALVLGGIAVLLALQSLYAEFLLTHVLDTASDSAPARLIDVLSVNIEESVPTWFSTLILFLAASLLAWIAILKHIHAEPQRAYWAGLAVIFLYLSADEGAAIHEIASSPVQSIFDTSGFLEFGWLLLGIPLVLLFGVAYLRFWLKLPEPTRRLFAIAAALFVGGAVVIESISAKVYSLDDGASFRYLAIATVEELCEMLGVTVFIYAQLGYLVQRDARLVIGGQGHASGFSAAGLAWPVSWLATAIAVAVIVLLLNAGLLAWSLAQSDQTATTAAAAPYHYYVMVEQLAGEGISITHFSGVFSPADDLSQRTATALLTSFPSVQILSLPNLNASIAVASDTPVLTDDSIIELMEWIDQTEYIFYDTDIIRAMIDLP